MDSTEGTSSTMPIGDKFEGILLTWKIENFSYIKNYRSLQSPSFASNACEWDLRISIENGSISFSMKNLKLKNYPCCWSCAVLDCDGMPLIWKEALWVSSFDRYIYLIDFAPLDMFLSNKIKFLPNDTLTIQCRLWRSEQGLSTPVLRFARTQISPTAKVIKKSIIWDVVGVSSIGILTTLERIEKLTEEESIAITLRLDYEEEFHFGILAPFIKDPAEIEIAVLDASKKEIVFANHENQCRFPNQMLVFSTNITRAMLRCYSNQFLSADTLSLQITFVYLENVIFNRMVDEIELLPQIDAPVRETSESIEPQSPNPEALQAMLDDGFLSDFNLRVGRRVFPVHRSILSLKSRVLRAMITAEMKENGKNILDIEDMDEDTLQGLLQFIYSDRFDKYMGWKKASSLYTVAHTYALETLKEGCSGILKSELNIQNALYVLSLADMHHDHHLESEAVDYISLKDKNIVGTYQWTKLKEKNVELAYDTLLSLYLKKMNQW